MLSVRLTLVFAAAGLGLAADKPVDFDREVRPILSDHCFTCHGPDDKRRMANLRLDTEDGLAARRDRIVPRITAADASGRMPPPQARDSLTDAQIATIRKWIEQGAHWERHWSFTAP